MREQIRKLYDSLGLTYLHDIRDAVPPELEPFMEMLPAGATVLDVGCAGGRDSRALADRGFKVIGIDLSDVFLNEARTLVPEGDFRNMDLLDADFPDGSVDAVWAQAVLLHVSKDDMPTALNHFYRMLKPGGKLHVRVKRGDGEQQVTETLQTTGEVSRPFFFYQQPELEDYIMKAGFKIISSNLYPDGLGRKDVTWITIWAEK